MNWQENIGAINQVLNGLSVRDHAKQELEPDQAIKDWQLATINLRHEKRRLFLIGNGASASMASHISADLSKNARLSAEVFSDLSLITAIANDLSYEEVFAEPLRRRMVARDMLVAISSSGNSPNIVRAVKEAKGLGGMVVTISAMGEDNAIRQLGHLNLYVPAPTYGLAETAHAAILHHWVDQVVGGEG
jgi:D-sedoheptulose 7-phosphate isomerase